jgi:uncharacterized protein YyaL (SSP411 family)
MAPGNRLAAENSPYLRQHAANPVDWYPWGQEAFAEARARDVPVLLSVGYSACHWCHVMAHESFEDPEVAVAMNSGFVNVKVDREERPDVDAVYMEAVQAVTGAGGWPMTVFLLPDGRPFHGGTYFPRSTFRALLARICELWGASRGELESGAEALSEAVRQGTSLPSLGWAASGDPEAGRSPSLLDVAASGLVSRMDAEWGGLGRAPKFPQPAVIETLLLARRATGRLDLSRAITTTLDAMSAGGIYDHLAGGFARYSTDRTWLVPHFEKMLYDNALLARLYLHAWQETRSPRYAQVVEETLGYLLEAPMRIAGAGFASAEDADSEGVEGRFYVWDRSEVIAVAGEDTASWYGVSEEGNWEGKNILYRPPGADPARPPAVEAGRAALRARRDARVRPSLDDKVLTEWNCMAVAALAEAGAAMERAAWVSAAEEVAGFLLGSLRRGDGRWLRSWQAGSSRHLACAGDYSWLVEAFTRLAEATGRRAWVYEASRAADGLVDLFWDPGIDAFRSTGSDGENLVARPVDTHDGALPSANSVAAAALLRLGTLTGADRYRDISARVVSAMGRALGAAPIAFAVMVGVAHLTQVGLTEVVVTGDSGPLLRAVRQRYLPEVVLAWGEPYDSPIWEGRDHPGPDGLAFVCRDYACRAPTRDPEVLDAELAGIHPPR